MIRASRDHVLFVGCAAFFVALLAVAGSDSAADPLQQLLQRWEKRDGAATVEVSHALSQEFVHQPKPFLLAMSSRPELWNPWLEGLPNQTFTVFIAGKKVEYEALRADMLRASSGLLADPKVGTLAAALKSTLIKVQVREID